MKNVAVSTSLIPTMIGLGESKRSAKDVGNANIIGWGHFNGCNIAWKRRLWKKEEIVY